MKTFLLAGVLFFVVGFVGILLDEEARKDFFESTARDLSSDEPPKEVPYRPLYVNKEMDRVIERLPDLVIKTLSRPHVNSVDGVTVSATDNIKRTRENVDTWERITKSNPPILAMMVQWVDGGTWETGGIVGHEAYRIDCRLCVENANDTFSIEMKVRVVDPFEWYWEELETGDIYWSSGDVLKLGFWFWGEREEGELVIKRLRWGLRDDIPYASLYGLENLETRKYAEKAFIPDNFETLFADCPSRPDSSDPMYPYWCNGLSLSERSDKRHYALKYATKRDFSYEGGVGPQPYGVEVF